MNEDHHELDQLKRPKRAAASGRDISENTRRAQVRVAVRLAVDITGGALQRSAVSALARSVDLRAHDVAIVSRFQTCETGRAEDESLELESTHPAAWPIGQIILTGDGDPQRS